MAADPIDDSALAVVVGCMHGIAHGLSIADTLAKTPRVARSQARQADGFWDGTGVWAWCPSTACASHEDGQDRHLIEQPMLGRWGSGTGWPAMVSSMATRSSSPVTGLPLPGVDWSNAPR